MHPFQKGASHTGVSHSHSFMVDNKINYIFRTQKINNNLKTISINRILERLESENPSWSEAGRLFISSVNQLLERLLDYRNVMQGEENRDKRMSCTVNLLNFYKNSIDRKEMYLRYDQRYIFLNIIEIHKNIASLNSGTFTNCMIFISKPIITPKQVSH